MRVVLPASGCEMMAKVRREAASLRISGASDTRKAYGRKRLAPRGLGNGGLTKNHLSLIKVCVCWDYIEFMRGFTQVRHSVIALLGVMSLLLSGLLASTHSVLAAPPVGSTLTGLAAYWSFDSSSNFNVPDVGGSTLTKGNGASWSASGKFGGALSLNGNSQSLYDLSSPAYLPVGNSSYTQSVWFRPSVVNNGGLMGWGSYGNTKRTNALRMSGAGSGGFYNYWWDVDLYCSPSLCPLSSNTWYHVVTTYNGTTRSLYLDGVLKASDTNLGPNDATAAEFHIGKTCCAEYFTGLIDDVAIYNRALTSSEVAELANSAVPTNSSIPTVTGIARTGETLSASTGAWSGSPSSYTYQWKRANAVGDAYSNINSATSNQYLLTDSDIGKYIKVSVVATNAVGASSAVLSAATSVVVDLADSVVPTTSTPIATATGFTFTISNYSDLYTYSLSSSSGSVARTADAVVVTGLSAGSSATVTIVVTRTGYRSASRTVAGSAIAPAVTSTTTVAPAVVIDIQVPSSSASTVPQGQAAIPTVSPSTSIAKSSTSTTIPNVTSRNSTTVPTTAAPQLPKPTNSIAPPVIPKLSVGESALNIGGESTKAEVTRENNQLVIQAGSLRAELSGLDDNGATRALDEDGNLRLSGGDVVKLNVGGFQPKSKVDVWLFSTPQRLGSAVVGADGRMSGSFTIPKVVEKGSHRIAITAKLPNGKSATFSIGIAIGEIDRTSTLTRVLIAIPIAVAVLAGFMVPNQLRRRRRAS